MASDDFDDFSDDIADEDLMQAVDEAQLLISQQTASSNPRHAPQGKERSLSTTISELQGLPDDVFSSHESQESSSRRQISIARPGLGIGNLRQTTLWGTPVDEDSQSQSFGSAAAAPRPFRNDTGQEKPTHHEIDHEAIKTWIYPMNLGAIRDYQYSIVKNSLFNNTLVALPTGLGKTFIAATVMLNFYRWTKKAKIVFVAPTKPLVSQQVDACFHLVGIPRSDTTLLTGETSPGLRAHEWDSKRVFFMTPQTLHNDLHTGWVDPKSIALIVVDEAHRAVGEYAYAKVAKFIRRFSSSVRILALTATPGSKVETVQEVIDNLGISHVEIRTEESLDIRQYVHQRNIEEEIIEYSDDIHTIRELLSKALKPLVDKLSQQNIYWGRDPMALTTYGLVKMQQDWWAGAGRQQNQGVQNMMRAVFGVLMAVAHPLKLLNFHGIKPFYDNMVTLRSETEAKGGQGSKYKKQLIQDDNFQEMMDTIDKWIRRPDFVGHPKLSVLTDRVLNHFMDHPTQSSSTKVIVFSEYRDSAEEIVRVLNTHKPLIRPTVFVGQADSKRSEGMKQNQQIKTIEDFKEGKFNVLVATSIGEEGLDIGQVDLIICYDASSSPIRMLQRMGRTGRKRAGRIILLLVRGKEEDHYAKSKDTYAAMQKLICEGSRFNFRHDLSTRIVPRGVVPEVDKKVIDIPIENTQNPALPEPKKTRAPKKRPPKKFHMPEGVETGFMKASSLGKPKPKPPKPPEPKELDFIADIPSYEDSFLTEQQEDEFRRIYRDLPVLSNTLEEDISMPSLDAYPKLQRSLRPTVYVRHGERTTSAVRLFKTLGDSQRPEDRYEELFDFEFNPRYRELDVPPFASSSSSEEDEPTKKRPQPEDLESAEEPDSPPKRRKISLEHPTQTHRTNSKNPPTLLFAASSQVEIASSSSSPTSSPDLPAPPYQQMPNRQKGPLRRTIGRPPPRPKAPKPKQPLGINSSEVGDDCMRTSDMLDHEDSDNGSDLLDFIVSDGEEEEVFDGGTSPREESLPPLLPPPVKKKVGTEEKQKRFYEPIKVDEWASDDDLPPLSQVLGQNGTKEQGAGKRRVRSRAVIDSDSDSL